MNYIFIKYLTSTLSLNENLILSRLLQLFAYLSFDRYNPFIISILRNHLIVPTRSHYYYSFNVHYALYAVAFVDQLHVNDENIVHFI